MGISINGPSGIDTAFIIESLVALEMEKVKRVEVKRSAFQIKIDAYSNFQTMLTDLSSSANSLKSEEGFNVFETVSSNEDVVTLKGSSGANPGMYDVSVNQMAQREKLISNNNTISSQTTALVDLGFTAGTFSINGTEIAINATDTIQDLRREINSARDADGNSIGVNATVLKMADDNFRLIISSTETGETGASYEDLNGDSLLQQLGFISTPDGDKGIVTQSLQSADDINSAFSAMAVGETIEYSGVDHFGNTVSNSFVVSATSTIDDLVAHMNETFHGMADITISAADGTMTMTSKSGGGSGLRMDSFTMAGVDHAFNINDVGYKGQNILSVGKDAHFSVDGLYMQSDKNTATGFIDGVTLELHKKSIDEVVTVEMNRDYEAIADKVQEMITAYNAVNRFVKSTTSFGEMSEDGESVSNKGKLSGDMTTRAILSQLRSMFQNDYDVSGNNTIKAFSQIGLKTNTGNSEYELDRTELVESLEESFDEVISLFVTKGYSDNPEIIMGTYDDDVKDGVYTLTENADGLHYQIQSQTGQDQGVYDSNSRQGEIVSFNSGPATGLSLTAPAGSGDATFTFSRGLAGNIDRLIKELVDKTEGTISMRQESWSRSMESMTARIMTLEDRVESYRIRLVKQFTSMEITLSSLNAQSSNMMSQLGYTTR